MKTVLFIEDNKDIRENAGEILELANYRVLLAANGKEGVETALAEKPDIIICDIMMPELDGYGVIHLLQKNRETQNIPFIFLTARAERSEIRKGMELGADDYITKPFSGTELLNAIEGRLKKAETARAALPEIEASFRAADTDSRSLQQVFIASSELQEYEKKQRIYNEGSHAYRLYYVQSGKVKVFRTNEDGKDLIMSICQEGDFFGYTALLESMPYEETAEVLERAEIASISRETFESLMSNNREVMLQLIRMLAGNVREKEEQLLGIAYNSLRKKVAEALVLLHRKYGQGSNSSSSIHISRENLAAMAGTAKESLIRTLGEFRNEGLIDIREGQILILQAAKLENMFN